MTQSTLPSRFRLSCALALATLLGLAMAGEAKAATAEQRAACTPDALRLCSSEIPDVGRVTACMKANRSNLSPRCLATLPDESPHRTVLVERRADPIRVAGHRDHTTHRVAVAAVRHEPARHDLARHGSTRYQEARHARVHYREARRDGQPRHHSYGQAAGFNQFIRIAGPMIGRLQSACATDSASSELCQYQRYIPASLAGGLGY